MLCNTRDAQRIGRLFDDMPRGLIKPENYYWTRYKII